MKKFNNYYFYHGLFLWIVGSIHWFVVVNANNNNNNNNQIRYSGHCYLKNKPIVKLLYDPFVSSYSRDEDHPDDQRFLQQQKSSYSSSLFGWTNPRQDAIRVVNDPLQQQRQLTINTTTTTTNNNNNTKQLVFDVRECSCVTDSQYPKYTYYCPLELEVCFVPRCASKECLWRK